MNNAAPADASSLEVAADLGLLDGAVWQPLQWLLESPRWPAERVLALPGRCRGAALSRWADNCRRRWGKAAVAQIRAELGEAGAELADDPPTRSWVPAALQVRVTDLIIDGFLDGDALALEALAVQDGRRTTGWAGMMVLRQLGPERIFASAPRIHRWILDVGVAGATAEQGGTRILWQGAALFENPTWRLLQAFAIRAAIAGTGRETLELRVGAPAAECFAIAVTWK